MIVGIDREGKWGSHIYCGTEWINDEELDDWKKVGNDNVRTVC